MDDIAKMRRSRKKLLAKCKEAGFVRYEHLNPEQLKDLLERGHHYISPKRRECYLKIHSRRGPKPEDFDCNVHRTECVSYFYDNHQGFICRGVDLEGMFDSQFVSDTTVSLTNAPPQRARSRFFRKISCLAAHDDHDDTTEDEYRLQTRVTFGGWFVPFSRWDDFTKFRKSLDRNIPPRSLQELAANVVLSKDVPPSLPAPVILLLERLFATILHT